ncbi:putative 6-phosphofructokinase [Helianthus anomalus]
MGPPPAATLSQPKIVTGNHGYILDDVPHLADYIPDLPIQVYSVVKWNRCSDGGFSGRPELQR